MTRHLLLAGFLFSSTSVALAETADDKPAVDATAEAITLDAAEGEVAEKRGGKGRSSGKSSARSSSRPSSSSSRPAASPSSRPAASPSSRPAASPSSRP
ncbi:MAG: hypothetical protein P8R54_27525, partial [Myxococcota bacterium]|nr:hypothetical protein [Myxococcota bacterium]